MATYAGLFMLAFVIGYFSRSPKSASASVTESLPEAFLPSSRQLRAWFKERR